MLDKIAADINHLFYTDQMPDSRTINVEGIGAVFFRRSCRARRIVISVSHDKGVRVSVPARSSLRKALDFVETKKGWIQKHLAVIERNERRRQALGLNIQTIDKAEATKLITERLHFLAGKHGFTCNHVTVRQQKTRWGSCSPKNNISLNIKLTLLPEAFRDYVIFHELVHTRIHNHSRKFWAELDKYVPGSKAMARQLRTNEMVLL